MASVLDLLMGEFSGGTKEEMRRKSGTQLTRYFTENGEAVRRNPNDTVTYGRFDSLGQFVPFKNNAERQRYKRERELLRKKQIVPLSTTKTGRRRKSPIAG